MFNWMKKPSGRIMPDVPENPNYHGILGHSPNGSRVFFDDKSKLSHSMSTASLVAAHHAQGSASSLNCPMTNVAINNGSLLDYMGNVWRNDPTEKKIKI